MPELLTVAEVAARLRVSEQTVWRYIKAGDLPASKVGAQWRIDPDDVTALLERGRSAPGYGEAEA